MGDLVSIEEIRAAAGRIAGVAWRTPLVAAPWAGDLWVKAESLQPIGAFKVRGVGNKMATLSERERARGVIAHSSGNHAQAVAYVARSYGVPATLVVPDVAPAVKVAATRGYGAEVVLVPAAEREAVTRDLAERHGYTEIPPYDDRDVIAGQGTLGLEIVADLPDVDVVLVPVSGGGLISGVASAVTLLRPEATVIGVEPELAADARDSIRQGRLVTWPTERTYRTSADGLRVSPVGDLPWDHIRARVADIVTVSEEEIGAAMRLLATRSRLVAEPSGAVATAAHLFRGAELPPGRRVAVLSGGNVDPTTLAAALTTTTDTDT